MKKVLALSAATLLVGGFCILQSCNKVADALKVNVPLETSIDFTIPASDTAGALDLAQQDIYLNVDSIIKANDAGLGIGTIKSVAITSCVLEMHNSDAVNNLGILQACKAEIKSDVNSVWVTVAEVANNPDNQASTLNVPVIANIDLAAYFKTTNFSYHISGTLRRAATQEMHCTAVIKYTLVAGL
jgi:hypothetical protein